MADLEDVEEAIKSLITGAIYPNGPATPSINDPSAILVGETFVPCAVFRGWPVKEQLARDLAAGIVSISIFTPPQSMRNTDRFPPGWVDLTTPDPTITLTINGTHVTLGGTMSSPQNVCLNVDRKPYIYAVQQEDDLDAVAAGLAALINVDQSASATGAVVSVPGAFLITGAVGTEGTITRVLRQQEQMFDVTIWAPTPALRKAVASFVDGVMAGVGLENPREFLAMPDDSLARLIYRGSRMNDAASLQGVYRRDLVYSVDYATTEIQTATEVVSVQNNVTNQ